MKGDLRRGVSAAHHRLGWERTVESLTLVDEDGDGDEGSRLEMECTFIGIDGPSSRLRTSSRTQYSWGQQITKMT